MQRVCVPRVAVIGHRVRLFIGLFLSSVGPSPSQQIKSVDRVRCSMSALGSVSDSDAS
jgi:hypothetical protein